MKLSSKIAASAIAASLAFGVAAPASAQGWGWEGQFRQQINQLERQVDYRRGISSREARELGWQVDRLKAKYDQYAYNGFNRDEVRTMRNMIDNVQRVVANQARDGNRYGNYDRYAQNDRYDRDWRGGYRR